MDGRMQVQKEWFTCGRENAGAKGMVYMWTGECRYKSNALYVDGRRVWNGLY